MAIFLQDRNPSKQEEYMSKSQKCIQSIRAFFYLCINEQDKLKRYINMSDAVANELFRQQQMYQLTNKSKSEIEVSQDKTELQFDPIYRKSCIYQNYSIIRKICGPDSVEFQEEVLRMSQICYELGQLEECQQYLNSLEDQLSLHALQNSSFLKPLYYEQSQLLFEMNKYEESLKVIEKLLALFEGDEKNSIDYSQVLSLQVAVLTQLNQFDLAIEAKRLSLKIKIKILGLNHIEVKTGEKLLKTIQTMQKKQKK